jgi:hypothetical protein
MFLAVFAALLAVAILAGFAAWLLLRDTTTDADRGLTPQCAADLRMSRDPDTIACNDDDRDDVLEWLSSN